MSWKYPVFSADLGHYTDQSGVNCWIIVQLTSSLIDLPPVSVRFYFDSKKRMDGRTEIVSEYYAPNAPFNAVSSAALPPPVGQRFITRVEFRFNAIV